METEAQVLRQMGVNMLRAAPAYLLDMARQRQGDAADFGAGEIGGAMGFPLPTYRKDRTNNDPECGCPFCSQVTQPSTEGVQAALDNNLSIPTPEIWALTIDEIGSVFDQSAEGKKHLEVCPRCLEGFRRYVQGLGATPADFGQADWTAVKPVLAGGPKATTYYTRKFNNYATASLFADLAAAFDAKNAKKRRSLAQGEKSGPAAQAWIMGIPMSILYANAAKYATAQQDEKNFLAKTVIPECDFIASVLNAQVFEKPGLYWEFLLDSLDAMQEDERQRSDALVKRVSVLADPIFEIAAVLLGYELDVETWEKLRALWAERKERAAQVQEQMQPKEDIDPEQETAEEESEQESQEAEAQDERVKSDLEKWRVKSLKRLREGESAAVTFTSDFIPAWRNAEIIASLANCQTADDVRTVFAAANNGNGHEAKTVEADYAPLVEALREATAALRGTADGA